MIIEGLDGEYEISGKVTLKKCVDYNLAIDSVGGNYGTLHGFTDPQAARSTNIPSVLTGRSLAFQDTHVHLRDLIPGNPFNATYACWMNCNDPGWFRSLWGSEAGTHTPNIGLFMPDGRIQVGSGNTPDSVTWALPVLPINTWHHIVFRVTSQSTIRLYINGVSKGDRMLAPGVTRIDILGSAWRGLLDDFRYYNAALTDAHVVMLKDGLNPPVTPINHWKFDEGV